MVVAIRLAAEINPYDHCPFSSIVLENVKETFTWVNFSADTEFTKAAVLVAIDLPASKIWSSKRSDIDFLLACLGLSYDNFQAEAAVATASIELATLRCWFSSMTIEWLSSTHLFHLMINTVNYLCHTRNECDFRAILRRSIYHARVNGRRYCQKYLPFFLAWRYISYQAIRSLFRWEGPVLPGGNYHFKQGSRIT